jgi:hypothetical protein
VGGGELLNINCVFILSTNLLVTFLTLKRNERDMVINVRTSSSKAPLFLSDFNQIWIFSTDSQKLLKYQISWLSAQCQPSYTMQTDTPPDIRRSYLLVAFLNFAYAPKNDLATDSRKQTDGSDLPMSCMVVQRCSVTHREMCTVIKHMLGEGTNIKLRNTQTATNHTNTQFFWWLLNERRT